MTPSDWMQILTPWALVTSSGLLFMRIRSLRARADRQAAQILLRVLRPRVRASWLVWGALGCFAVAAQWGTTVLGTTRSTEFAAAVAYTLFVPLALLTHSKSGGDIYIEARENGIVVGIGFWPWGHVRDFAWLDNGPTVRLQIEGYGFAEYRVATAQRAALDRRLQERGCRTRRPTLQQSGI